MVTCEQRPEWVRAEDRALQQREQTIQRPRPWAGEASAFVRPESSRWVSEEGEVREGVPETAGAAQQVMGMAGGEPWSTADTCNCLPSCHPCYSTIRWGQVLLFYKWGHMGVAKAGLLQNPHPRASCSLGRWQLSAGESCFLQCRCRHRI